MTNLLKFGKKIPIPSTIEIKHELRLMAAADDLVAAGLWDEPQFSDVGRRQLAGELSRRHGLSVDRAEMLVDRFGAVHARENAAALRTR